MNNTIKKTGLSIAKLNKILLEWKKNFDIENWDIRIKIIEFKRKDYRQSGDIKIDLDNKKATLLMTKNPFLDEEEVIVHELVHLLLWQYDMFAEQVILKNCKKYKNDHMVYLRKLEKTVDKLTNIFLGIKKSSR